MESQWREREILFLGHFKVLNRQIIIFHLASGDKTLNKLLSFYWEGKKVVLDFATSQAKFQLINKRPVPNKQPGGQKLN